MSDNGLADDLFGESENGSAIREPSPIASSSKSPAPLKEELEVKDEDEAEDAGDLVRAAELNEIVCKADEVVW